jgi:hypothetical protein
VEGENDAREDCESHSGTERADGVTEVIRVITETTTGVSKLEHQEVKPPTNEPLAALSVSKVPKQWEEEMRAPKGDFESIDTGIEHLKLTVSPPVVFVQEEVELRSPRELLRQWLKS